MHTDSDKFRKIGIDILTYMSIPKIDGDNNYLDIFFLCVLSPLHSSKYNVKSKLVIGCSFDVSQVA